MRIFLLGPGYFEGDHRRNALHKRLALGESLAPHAVDILELSDSEERPLTDKFSAAMNRAEAVVVWLPLRAKLSTVFGELPLLRYEKA